MSSFGAREKLREGSKETDQVLSTPDGETLTYGPRRTESELEAEGLSAFGGRKISTRKDLKPGEHCIVIGDLRYGDYYSFSDKNSAESFRGFFKDNLILGGYREGVRTSYFPSEDPPQEMTY